MIVKTITDKQKLLDIAASMDISTVYDCGSRDALDGIELVQIFNARELHIFECNPSSFLLCKKNIDQYLNKNEVDSFVNELAISDEAGEISFYKINTEKTKTVHSDGNPGASSMFEANENYKNETYVQDKITVAATTIDNYCETHSHPDLLWMDLQGAELLALKGAQAVLDKVKIIHVEVGFRAMYKGQALYWELNDFLRSQNFKMVSLDIGRWPNMLMIYKILNTGPWVGNAIYVNQRQP